MDKFICDLKQYLQPFWKSKRIVNETLMLVGEKDFGVLLYEPKKILSVKNYFLDKNFCDNLDYKIEGKNFIRLSDNIPYWEENEYYTSTFEKYEIGVNEELCARFREKRYLKYDEWDTFTKKQLAISYLHESVWGGPIPQSKKYKFTNIINKLKSREDCKFLFYGDSISTGCNASGTHQGGNTAPYMPPFHMLVCNYLQEKFGSKIDVINTSVGGKNTNWGLENLQERVIKYSPNIVFIAFGMNDPATPRNVYKQMVREMIEKIHKNLPDTEIMLVSSILPNNESDEKWFANQQYFHIELAELENEYSFVGLANVTVMQEYMLKNGKHYRDMTANNINHPNDFGHRLYAQVILTTLLGEDFSL